MSAVARPGPVSLRALRESDLNAVMAIELRGYPFPGPAASSSTACAPAIPAWRWSAMAC